MENKQPLNQRPFYAFTLGEMKLIAQRVEGKKDNGVYIMRDAPLELVGEFNFSDNNGAISHARALTMMLSCPDMANAVTTLANTIGDNILLNSLALDDEKLSSLAPEVTDALSLALTRLGEEILRFNAPKSDFPDLQP